VKTVGTCRVIDALRDWGSQGGAARMGREIVDVPEAVDRALTHYAPFVARILAARPFGCVRAELFEGDISQLQVHDRRPVQVTTGLYSDSGDAGDRIRALVDSEAPVVGPLTCACRGARMESGGFGLHVPLLIFDGWHRATAWALHQRAGRSYPISANIIVTEEEVA